VYRTEDEEAEEALATPLLPITPTLPTSSSSLITPRTPSEVDEFGAQLLRESWNRSSMATTSPTGGTSLTTENSNSNSNNNNSNNSNNTNTNNSIFSSMMMASTTTGHSSSSSSAMIRGTIASCLRIRTLSDALPSLLQPLVSNGKMSVVFFLGGQLLLLVLWIPFWILSFPLVSEGGVYCAVVVTIVVVGRAIIRMIAFPGSSHRVSSEIEKEFAKYSVRVLTASATGVGELAAAVRGASGSRSSASEIPQLWNRAQSYRDRVLSVYAVVLQTTLGDTDSSSNSNANASNTSPSGGGGGSSSSNLNHYGNNVLVGDVGNLSGLTPEAISDGRVLLHHLENVLAKVDTLEGHAKSVFETNNSFMGGGSSSIPSDAARQAASALMEAATELKNVVESLKPPSSTSENGGGDDGESSGSATELQPNGSNSNNSSGSSNSGSLVDAIKMGLSSILPMLDPPLHSSIFGFDVLRGCVLSRYRGARQLWVPRPGGGRIDCLHIPSSNGSAAGRGTVPATGDVGNSKAVVYCNPNAGLIEVATGMSLAGGNVASDIDNVVNDNCWTDFYTNAGFDIYLYNYAGFGRSHGPPAVCGMCSSHRGTSNHEAAATTAYTPGVVGRIRRIVYGVFFSFTPTPDTLRADGLAVARHVISHAGVESLVLHGESIGGLAASGAARKLTNQSNTATHKVALLLCDRTFCNLEAVAQRLVGGWSGYAIRLLAPFWSTDVVGDFLAATCPKVVATDSADAIIADSSSLKAGISFWKEMKRSTSSSTNSSSTNASSTKGIGWIMEAPLQYRMADWENVCVTGSRYVSQPPFMARMTAPLWPSDKHISLDEAFHFAACAKRIGKLASIEKRRFAVGMLSSSAGGVLLETNDEPTLDDSTALDSDSCQAPIYLVWKYLGCCEGLCGAPLGVTVKGGFDTTVSWLFSLCVFGGQTVVEGIEHRRNLSNPTNNTNEAAIAAIAGASTNGTSHWNATATANSRAALQLGPVENSDFDCRPPGFEDQESDVVVHPKPIPEVLEALRKIVEDHPNDPLLNSVSHEVAFAIGTLEYVMLRLSAPASLETSWKSRHLTNNGSMKEGSFLNLHCGHNNPYSDDERKRLRAVLKQVSKPPLPAIV